MTFSTFSTTVPQYYQKKNRLKKTRIIIIIIILLTMLINTGCLTMQYYPAKVAKPGKMYLGLGIHEESREGWGSGYISNLMLFNAIFLRYGLPNNFDIGFNIHGLMIIPYMLSINVRKQFNLSNDLIHSITFNIGSGISFTQELYTSISAIRNDFALTFGFKHYIIASLIGSSLNRNEFLLNISKEFEHKRFNTMPFIYYKVIQQSGEYSSDSKVFQQIGIGISFYFDLL